MKGNNARFVEILPGCKLVLSEYSNDSASTVHLLARVKMGDRALPPWVKRM